MWGRPEEHLGFYFLQILCMIVKFHLLRFWCGGMVEGARSTQDMRISCLRQPNLFYYIKVCLSTGGFGLSYKRFLYFFTVAYPVPFSCLFRCACTRGSSILQVFYVFFFLIPTKLALKEKIVLPGMVAKPSLKQEDFLCNQRKFWTVFATEIFQIF